MGKKKRNALARLVTGRRQATVADFRRGQVVPGRVAEQAAGRQDSPFKAAKKAAAARQRRGGAQRG